MSACAWCLVCDWWTRLSTCLRDVSWHCTILARKLHQVNKVWTVFWNAWNVLSRTYDVLMHCHWWLPMSRTWCTNAAVIGIEYHWRSWGWECISIVYCVSAIRSYCQNTSRLPFLLSARMQSHQQTGLWAQPVFLVRHQVCSNQSGNWLRWVMLRWKRAYPWHPWWGQHGG